MPLFPMPDGDGYDPDRNQPITPSETGIDQWCETLHIRGLRLLDENGSPDDEVVRLINHYLEKAFLEQGELSVGDRLGRAFLFASQDREAKSTTDENLRNADRYLYALAASAQKDLVNTVVNEAAPLYEGLKYIAHSLKDNNMPAMERLMRSANGKPTSKASIAAIRWADKGLKAGRSIDGEQLVEVSPKSNRDMTKPRCGDTRDMQLRKP